jgi:hypothetical protein
VRRAGPYDWFVSDCGFRFCCKAAHLGRFTVSCRVVRLFGVALTCLLGSQSGSTGRHSNVQPQISNIEALKHIGAWRCHKTTLRGEEGKRLICRGLEGGRLGALIGSAIAKEEWKHMRKISATASNLNATRLTTSFGQLQSARARWQDMNHDIPSQVAYGPSSTSIFCRVGMILLSTCVLFNVQRYRSTP